MWFLKYQIRLQTTFLYGFQLCFMNLQTKGSSILSVDHHEEIKQKVRETI